jgi:glycosyltransferase involved in cell wall biosynthesis
LHKLRIAIIADPELPVPPLLYGGIERIIAMLIEGYTRFDHQVSLFAHADSVTEAKLFAYKGKTSNRNLDLLKNMWLINKELLLHSYDVVHSFGRLAYLLPVLQSSTAKIMSYQRDPTISQIKKVMQLAKKGTMTFTGCSEYISKKISPYAVSHPIFNGVELTMYDFKEIVALDAPLIFLGRIEPIKGTHIAIEVAKKTGKKLIIAGNIPAEYQSYFNTLIKPQLNDQITYIGAVTDIEKNKILGEACAFLMPIEWDEPFGIVMAEAMACGTPVIAFNRGSVPEVVIHGVNGYRCDTIEEMISYVIKIKNIDRQKVRKDAEERFSSEVIVREYLNLYRTLKKG